ncbi:uncharacterized protein [Miscanthus floridulus]|uniref:uncharacterized protein n=1 Tax=Miscanthus floridulus TaxID=154761 RepID=UPI0034578C3C
MARRHQGGWFCVLTGVWLLQLLLLVVSTEQCAATGDDEAAQLHWRLHTNRKLIVSGLNGSPKFSVWKTGKREVSEAIQRRLHQPKQKPYHFIKQNHHHRRVHWVAKNKAPTIGVKLFVDKEKRKVLFAESEKEFVDVLFGLLTMPLGTVVRLLDKQSQMGCLDEVYKSVEDLSTDYFQTKACKAMLLKPLNAASRHCCRLKINVDGSVPRVVYVCKDTSCSAHSDNAFSSFPDTVCECGKDGVFVKGCLKFIVTDDLHVAPALTSLMMSVFEKFGVRDPAVLEQQVLQFSSEKVLCLYKRILVTKQPLTEHYFDVPVPHDDANLYTLVQNLNPKQEIEDEERLGNLKIRVLQMTNNSALLYAEVGGDFVDSLFGLLSIPLGSVMKSFGQCSAKGCLDNLYRSIDGSYDPNCPNKVKSVKLCEASPKQQNGGSRKSEQCFSATFCQVSTSPTRPILTSLYNWYMEHVMELQRAVLLSRNTLSSVLLPPKKIKNLNHLRY